MTCAGEIPRAFVVLKAPASADELMAYVAQRVAPYKKVRRLDFIDAIPNPPRARSSGGCSGTSRSRELEQRPHLSQHRLSDERQRSGPSLMNASWKLCSEYCAPIFAL